MTPAAPTDESRTCPLGDDCDLTVAWMAGRADLLRELAAVKAERDRLREIIQGVGANFWDKAEISERDDAGNQTILLWHPSGIPLLRLRIESHNPNMDAWHRDIVVADLLDVFNARAALEDTTHG